MFWGDVVHHEKLEWSFMHGQPYSQTVLQIWIRLDPDPDPSLNNSLYINFF
jgi:hypothetical protein